MINDEMHVSIPQSEYDELRERSDWLGWLEAAGVDKWIGWDEAIDAKNEYEENSSLGW